MIVKIDTDHLGQLVEKSDGIFLSADGEQALLSLLELQETIDVAVKEAKTKLADAAIKISPDFKSINGDHVKVYYREYGSRYYLDQSQIDDIPQNLYKVTTHYSIDIKAVEDFEREHNGLPVGIKIAKRQKSIVFTRKRGSSDS